MTNANPINKQMDKKFKYSIYSDLHTNVNGGKSVDLFCKHQIINTFHWNFVTAKQILLEPVHFICIRFSS